jgi:hypothetical protein
VIVIRKVAVDNHFNNKDNYNKMPYHTHGYSRHIVKTTNRISEELKKKKILSIREIELTADNFNKGAKLLNYKLSNGVVLRKKLTPPIKITATSYPNALSASFHNPNKTLELEEAPTTNREFGHMTKCFPSSPGIYRKPGGVFSTKRL